MAADSCSADRSVVAYLDLRFLFFDYLLDRFHIRRDWPAVLIRISSEEVVRPVNEESGFLAEVLLRLLFH
ncbi:Uncharacterised protein [Mycobacteroides abscessus subsp. abscessus]|nr:Uncharacterised protein [Mycobacteroides abscessus subsp. abscessus]